MKDLFSLFLIFAKMGAITFGGGYAMLPILQRELVQSRGWVTDEELLDYYAVGQCTPGIIAVNTATFIGYKRKGILGGIFATLGVVSPSVVIITLIAAFLRNFTDIPLVQNAFSGIRVCVCALIVQAVYKLLKSSVKNVSTALIFLIVLLLMVILSPSPILIVLAAGLTGVLLRRPFAKNKQKEESK